MLLWMKFWPVEDIIAQVLLFRIQTDLALQADRLLSAVSAMYTATNLQAIKTK